MAKNKKILLVVGTIVLLVAIATICLFAFKGKEKAIYVVAFNSNSGSAIPDQNIEEGMSATKPQDPIRDGYIFIEWLLNGESYNFNNAIDKNITLSAKWEEIVPGKEIFIIKFNTDGGTTIANSVIEKGSKVVRPTDPTKEGYTFVEWQLAGVTYDFELGVTDNLELFAKWEENKVSEKKPNKNNSGNNNNNNNNSQEKNENENVVLETPTLSKGIGGAGWAKLNIISEGVYGHGTSDISGYELYEKIGNQCKMIHTSETEFGADIEVDVGENKVFVARVYKYNKSNAKVYSAYSNEVEVGYWLETPTLSTPAGCPGWAQLNIVCEGAYANGTDFISGYELYEKIGNQYKIIHTSETEFCTDVEVDVGESRVFVARVYKYNKSNVKIYSEYSNEVEGGYWPETPTLSTPAGCPGWAQLNIVCEGAYANGTDFISGYELYEKIGNQYKIIHTSETEFCTDVEVDEGENRVFVARVYKYNKSNVKIYSAYSNEIVF